MNGLDVAELARRLNTLIRQATIETVDTSACRVVVRYGDFLSPPLPWLTSRAGRDLSWWSPSSGEQVIVFAPGGDLAQGVVLGALYSDSAKPDIRDESIHHITYSDGTMVSYDTMSHELAIDCKGDVTVKVAGKVSLGNAVSAVALASAVEQFLTLFQTAFNAHVHPASGTPPVTPFIQQPTVGASKLDTQ